MLTLPWRILCSLLCVVFYRVDAARHETRLSGKQLRHYRTAVLSKWAKRWLRMAQIRTTVSGTPPKDSSLVVTNHQGYFDVVVLAAHLRGSFVTSVEVEKAFFLGHMAKVGGSLFVERRDPRRMRSDMRQLRDTIDDGFPVYLFPEGTSSNGQNVLPFKAALFAAAGRAPVQPASITYSQIAGRRPVQSRLNRIAWYGDMTFPDHMIMMLAQPHFHVHLDWLPNLRNAAPAL